MRRTNPETEPARAGDGNRTRVLSLGTVFDVSLHSKSNSAGRIGNERDHCVESVERLGWQVQVDAVIQGQLLAEIYGGAYAPELGADLFGQRVGIGSTHFAADDIALREWPLVDLTRGGSLAGAPIWLEVVGSSDQKRVHGKNGLVIGR